MHPYAEDGREEAPRQHRDRYDWITLWAAIIGVVFVVITTFVTAYQAVLTRKALDASIAQQRAWLRVDIDEVRRFSLATEGGFLAYGAKITNVGSIPAQAVSVDSVLVAFLPDEVGPLMGATKRKCHASKFENGGEVVFPGEPVTIRTRANIPRSRIDRLYADELEFAVHTCITYWSGSPERQHQTERLFMIRRTEDRIFDTHDVEIEGKNLIVTPFEYGSNAYGTAN